MLRAPEKRIEASPPCYRCLFDQPISPYYCHPETCDMLEFWLIDLINGNDFKWENYGSNWVIKFTVNIIREEETFDES